MSSKPSRFQSQISVGFGSSVKHSARCGHGKQNGIEQEFRGKTYKTELLTKAKIEIVVNDADVERIVQAIREAALTGMVGDGKIFISSSIEDTVRIRTGEHGSIAV